MPTISFLQYGPAQGSPQFIELLASNIARLSSTAGGQEFGTLNPKSLFLTSGATAGLEALLGLIRPGSCSGTVFVEQPTYFLAPGVMAERGFHLVGVPTKDGVRPPQRWLGALTCLSDD